MNEFASRKMLKLRVAGEVFIFRPCSLRRLIADNALSPAMYEAITAKREGVATTDYEIIQARAADDRAFSSLIICQSCTSHKIVPFEPAPDSDDLWIEMFNDAERDFITDKLAEYNGCTSKDLEVIAPFRNPTHDDDAGGEIPADAVGDEQ
jgi:hypothetical protein